MKVLEVNVALYDKDNFVIRENKEVYIPADVYYKGAREKEYINLELGDGFRILNDKVCVEVEVYIVDKEHGTAAGSRLCMYMNGGIKLLSISKEWLREKLIENGCLIPAEY